VKEQQTILRTGCTWSFRPRAEIQLLMASHMIRRNFDSEFRNCYDSWSLTYPVTPGLRLKVGDARHRWFDEVASTAILIPAGTPFWEDDSAAGGRAIEGWALAFRVNDEVGLRALVDPRRGYAELRDPAHLLRDVIRRMADLGVAGGNAAHWAAFTELCAVFNLIHGARPLGPGRREIRPAIAPEASEFVCRVRAHLGRELERRVSLEQLARQLHVSRSQLTHRYRQETGESPHQAQLRMRVEKAKTLLQAGEAVKMAALSTGFCDEFHFSRVFRRLEGMPPSGFVRLVRG